MCLVQEILVRSVKTKIKSLISIKLIFPMQKAGTLLWGVTVTTVIAKTL